VELAILVDEQAGPLEVEIRKKRRSIKY